MTNDEDPLRRWTVQITGALAATVILFYGSSSQTNAFPRHEGEYAFWREMPNAPQVAAEMKGNDELDTAARRHAAFLLLRELVVISADGKGQLPWPEGERALNAAYLKEINDAVNSPAAKGDQYEMWIRSYLYQGDKSFTRQLLKRYFSEAALREVEPLISGFAADSKKHIDNIKTQRANLGSQATADTLNQLLKVLADATMPLRGIGMANYLLFLGPLLLALGLVREMRRFGLHVSDPFKIHSGWGSYDLHTITGTVLSPTKSHVVTTHSGGGRSYVRDGVVYQEPFTSSTTTSVHDQFFVRSIDGREQAVQLKDVDIALRDGHELSAVWSIKHGKKRGHYFLFRNHSMHRADFMDGVVRDMLKPHKWPVLPLMVVSATWGLWAVHALFHIAPSDFLGAVGWLTAAATGALVIFFFLRERVVNVRARRLTHQIAERLLPALDKLAAGQTSSAGARGTPG